MSFSTSGFEDGLGQRQLLFDSEGGRVLERLELRAEFGAFEAALRARQPFWSGDVPGMFTRIRAIDRAPSGAVVVISECPAGVRLADLLELSAGRIPADTSPATIDLAVGFLLQALPALASLHAATGLAHGSATAGHVFLGADGQVVFTDGLYGQVLERLQYSRRRLWKDLRLAMPAAAGPPRFTPPADVAQASMTALALALGRSLADEDYPDGLPRLVEEVVDISLIRGSASLASAVRRFLQRTLPVGDRSVGISAADALTELSDLARGDVNPRACRLALVAFVSELLDTPYDADVLATAADQDAGGADPGPCLDTTECAPPVLQASPAQEPTPQPIVYADPVTTQPPSAAAAPGAGENARPAPLGPPGAPSRPASLAVEDTPVRMPVFSAAALPAAPPSGLAITALAAPLVVAPPVATIPVRRQAVLFTEPDVRSPRADEAFTATPPRLAVPPRENAARGWWKLAAAIVLALLGGLAGSRGYMPEGATASAAPAARLVTPRPAPAAPSRGTLVLTSQPAGARVLLDGEPVGETPLSLEDVAPGVHTLTFTTASGSSVKRNVRVDAGSSVEVDVPVFSGWLTIFSPIILDVAERGRGFGSSEDARLLLPPGRHTLTLANEPLGYSSEHTVEIVPGEERRLTVSPRGTMHVNALPWAEVWIDGQRAGETPLANLDVLLGTRDILFKHPTLGERRVTVTVTATAPAAVSVDLTKSHHP